MFGKEIEYVILDELKFGDGKGTNLRLEENEKGRKRITLWSSLSSEWRPMYRYDVDNSWEKWKKTHANIHSEERKNWGVPGGSPKVERSSKNAKRKPGPKAGTKRTANSKSARNNSK